MQTFSLSLACEVGFQGPVVAWLWGLFCYLESTDHFCHWTELNAEKTVSLKNVPDTRKAIEAENY